MNRRELMGTLGAVGASMMAAQLQAAPEKSKTQQNHADHFEDCAQACADCQVACSSCSHHCGALLAEGHKEHVETLRSCADCADICATAASITGRQGIFSVTICEACVKACDDCAKACEKYPDDAHMKKCAEECRQCAKACRAMLAHG